MGLLDFLSTPDAQLGMGLLAAAGPRSDGAGFGQRMQEGMGYAQAQQDHALKRKMMAMQMQEQEQKAAQAKAMREILGRFSTPAQPGLAAIQGDAQSGILSSAGREAKPAGFDYQGYAGALAGIDPMKALALQQSLQKDDAPIKLSPGEQMFSGKASGYKPLLSVPGKEAALPSAIQEYQFAKGQGYGGTFEQWDTSRKRAGASSTNVSVNTEKSLLNNLAGGLGKSMTDARDGARSALSTIATVSRLTDALDSGKVMAGPGTSFRQYGLQIGNVLGVTGKDANEKLLNTRAAVQSLAQLELDAAQQMKGQGQITEAERSIIKRAASGDVDGMTTGELRILSGVLDRSARTKIQGYNSQIKPLMGNPNAAALAPFLGVEEPAARSSNGVIRFDANGNQVR